MTTIHAFRRTKPYVHEFPKLRLEFKPNVFGHVVCDVDAEWAVERLLETPTGFRIYDTEVVPNALSGVLTAAQQTGNVSSDEAPVESGAGQSLADPPPPPDAPVVNELTRNRQFILVSESGSFDLRPLSDLDLHAFAKANGVTVHPNAKGDTIRTKIVEALSKE